MPFSSIVWDLDDDPDGNVQHCAAHGVSKEEVEDVFQSATDADTVYPVTAYDVPRRHQA